MPKRPPAHDAARLERNVEWALRHSFDAGDVLPMVEQLVRIAEKGSSTWVFAHRHLAGLLLEKQPWRAAVAARMAYLHAPDDDAAPALLGLALTVLRHYRAAARAYRAALRIAPDNPWHAHNLGHLLDCALDRPRQAVPLLLAAHRTEPHAEIAASLAHALGRVGRVDEARQVLEKALRGSTPSDDHQALLSWLVQGAPPLNERSRGRPVVLSPPRSTNAAAPSSAPD